MNARMSVRQVQSCFPFTALTVGPGTMAWRRDKQHGGHIIRQASTGCRCLSESGRGIRPRLRRTPSWNSLTGRTPPVHCVRSAVVQIPRRSDIIPARRFTEQHATEKLTDLPTKGKAPLVWCFLSVGAGGFEPPTSWSRTKRASRAALRPEIMQSGYQYRPGVFGP
jgi:hypothetical protein